MTSGEVWDLPDELSGIAGSLECLDQKGQLLKWLLQTLYGSLQVINVLHDWVHSEIVVIGDSASSKFSWFCLRSISDNCMCTSDEAHFEFTCATTISKWFWASDCSWRESWSLNVQPLAHWRNLQGCNWLLHELFKCSFIELRGTFCLQPASQGMGRCSQSAKCFLMYLVGVFFPQCLQAVGLKGQVFPVPLSPVHNHTPHVDTLLAYTCISICGPVKLQVSNDWSIISCQTVWITVYWLWSTRACNWSRWWPLKTWL